MTLELNDELLSKISQMSSAVNSGTLDTQDFEEDIEESIEEGDISDK